MARVKAARDEISRIKGPDFPLQPRLGLEYIDEKFEELQKIIAEDLSADSDTESIQSVCEGTLWALDRYLPFIGFMLRATNVRNAFELHGPLLRLARQLLGPKTHVVLSSEWEFSPFTFRSIVELPNFVLIGLPASESGNGLIVPLAGHELGHAIYDRRNLEAALEPAVAAALVAAIETRWDDYSLIFDKLAKTDLAKANGKKTWEPYFDWAMNQCEETFCDFFGLRLFGESYLHAFAYLLAPCLHVRSPFYPTMKVRVSNLVKASRRLKIPVPGGFETQFRDNRDDFLPTEQLFCSLADEAVAVVVPSLITSVIEIAKECSIPNRNSVEISRALKDFRQVIPARKAPDLATIANAAWGAYHEDKLWKGYPDVLKRRQDVLNDLVLKSAEILEIGQRLVLAGVDA